MVSGEVFAVNCGTTMMPVLSVNSWDTLLMVIYYLCTHSTVQPQVQLYSHALVCGCKIYLLYSMHMQVYNMYMQVLHSHAVACVFELVAAWHCIPVPNLNTGLLYYVIITLSHYPHPRGRRVQYLVCVSVCLSVCLSVCVLPQNCCKLQLSQNLNKLQVTNLVI